MSVIVRQPWLLLGKSSSRLPSFDRNFLGGSLGPGAVFSRASTGTYYDSAGVLRSAVINAPRFDYDPATLQLKGLLLEDTSTNVVLNSGDASNASWSKTAGVVTSPVVTANNTAAPDGTTTAARVVYPAVSGVGAYSNLGPSFLAAAAIPYAFSVWLKGNVGGERVYLAATPDGLLYYRTQALLTTSWQRFSLITSNLSGTSWFFIIGTDLRDTTQTSAPAQTIYAWGAQVEALPYMSSYIPTTTVAVTRARDALSYPIAGVTGFNATQGSLAHEYVLEGAKIGFGAPVQFVGSNPATDFIDCDEYVSAGSTGTIPMSGGGGVWANGGSPFSYAVFGPAMATPANVTHRGASAWAIGANVLAAHDGVGANALSGTNPVAVLPTIANLTIAGPMHGQTPVSQWARRTRYWPRQLSQAELISVTA